MANRWKRWRDYMDELEEAMRMAGVELAAVERECALSSELEEWKQTQLDAVAPQLVAKARDIPFFSELLAQALALGPDFEFPAPPNELTPWGEDENESRQDSSAIPGHRALPDDLGPEQTSVPPARLRNAERALHHRTRALIPVLEELVTPRNGSAIVRSAEALGLHEIHFVDPRGKLRLNRAITRKCQRWMDLHWHRRPGDLVNALHRRGYTLLAADFGPNSVPLHEVEVKGPTAVVLGSEQKGVSPEMRDAVDGLFHLPTSGYTSYLNVSVTAGIALYELDRRLREAGLRSSLPENELNALRRAWYATLAGGNEERRIEYANWATSPPEPTPLLKPIPSREKSREETD